MHYFHVFFSDQRVLVGGDEEGHSAKGGKGESVGGQSKGRLRGRHDGRSLFSLALLRAGTGRTVSPC